MLRFWLALLFGVLAAFPAFALSESITVGTEQRTYLVFGASLGTPRPVIITLHGLDGTGLAAADATHLGQLAASAGFVAIFPDGLAKAWNHYPAGTKPAQIALDRWHAAGVPVPDDTAFINAIVDRVTANHVGDPNRIYLVGFSNGGFMALKLVCEDESRFAAVAIISTGMPLDNGAACAPPRPIPILIEHGTADDHMPYNGGLVFDHSLSIWPVDQLNQFFTKLDKCPGEPTDTPVKAKLVTQLFTWTCDDGPVEFYKVTQGVHTVYQFPPPAPTLWDFFKSHSL